MTVSMSGDVTHDAVLEEGVAMFSMDTAPKNGTYVMLGITGIAGFAPNEVAIGCWRGNMWYVKAVNGCELAYTECTFTGWLPLEEMSAH